MANEFTEFISPTNKDLQLNLKLFKSRGSIQEGNLI